jgi:hypothetical protein
MSRGEQTEYTPIEYVNPKRAKLEESIKAAADIPVVIPPESKNQESKPELVLTTPVPEMIRKSVTPVFAPVSADKPDMSLKYPVVSLEKSEMTGPIVDTLTGSLDIFTYAIDIKVSPVIIEYLQRAKKKEEFKSYDNSCICSGVVASVLQTMVEAVHTEKHLPLDTGYLDYIAEFVNSINSFNTVVHTLGRVIIIQGEAYVKESRKIMNRLFYDYQIGNEIIVIYIPLSVDIERVIDGHSIDSYCLQDSVSPFAFSDLDEINSDVSVFYKLFKESGMREGETLAITARDISTISYNYLTQFLLSIYVPELRDLAYVDVRKLMEVCIDIITECSMMDINTTFLVLGNGFIGCPISHTHTERFAQLLLTPDFVERHAALYDTGYEL